MPKKETTTSTAVSSAKKKSVQYFYSAGKRKTSVARVRLYINGKGDITVNDRPAEKYFTMITNMGVIKQPLKLTGHTNKFDISVKVLGGGVNSQAEAVRHGISRALLDFDSSLRATLKKAGLLTRDARIKERKKPGLKRARRAPQFSKR